MKHPYTMKVHILKNNEVLKGETILCNQGDLLFTMDWQQNKINKMSNGVDVFKTKNEIITNENKINKYILHYRIFRTFRYVYSNVI